jgi:DNA-binding transcriptional LysR family regulator
MATICHLWCEMAPIDLNLLRAFTALYEAGSFTRAAARLGVPRSTVSRAIAALEDQLGEQLVHRTTRTLAISAEGKELYDRVAHKLEALATALADRPERRDEPSGALKLTATPDLGAAVLAEAAVRFTTRYPRTQIELVLTPAVIDLVRDGFDFALRIVRRQLPDSGLLAQKVGALEFRLFAAPSYVARRGAPRTTRELVDHDWVGFKGVAPVAPSDVAGRRRLTEGRIVCDDAFVLRDLVRRGGGIGAMPSFLADDDLQAGTLVAVLPKLALVRAAIYLISPARKHAPARATAFRALLLEMLRQRPLTPS